MTEPESFFILYLALLLAPIIGLWIASAWRDRRLRAPLPSRPLFRCIECMRFYEADELVEKMSCPVCGRQNQRLQT
jgi:hypothetical protein